ncbi:MAG: insulinase family protein [Chloroflexota bacterium]|nr:insulinase family protein [Chloroflexota bacterium]
MTQSAVRPVPGAPRAYHFPQFARHALDNGLTVWLVPLAGRALVNVHLVLDGGAAAEDEKNAGIASLTAQLLVTGTRRLDATQFAEATERLGLEFGSESSWDSARASFGALSEQLEPALALLAEMIREPRLEEREFERLKAERLADIMQARADPGRLADEMFLRSLYADGVPYRRPAAGGPETVATLTVDDARGHHGTHYAPGSAHLIIAGAFEPGAALRAASEQLGEWAGNGPGHREVEPTSGGARRVVVVDRPGSVQSELRVGQVGIDRHDPRFFRALVMATILGGMFWSRLNRRLREELGYTYGARAGFDPRRSAGPFVAGAAVQTEVTVPAIRELLGLLDRLREAPPEERELREAKDFLVGVFPLRFETTGGVASAIEPLAVYGLADDYWQTYRGHIEAVSGDDVQRAAAELIRPEQLVILLSGDAARLRDELGEAGFGPVEVVSPD